MRIVGVIPARWESSRFPGKSITPILGKPMVNRVIEACLRSELLSEVVLATDDERIADAARDSGAIIAMTRADHPSGTDRVAEAARARADDIIINIQGDEPLVPYRLIDEIARKMLDDPSLEMATAAAPIDDIADLESPAVVKVVVDGNGDALYFSRSPIPFRRDGAPDLASGLYRRHIGIYAYRGAFLAKFVATPPSELELCEALEQLRAMSLGARIAVVDTLYKSIGVDRPEDVPQVEEALRVKIAARGKAGFGDSKRT